MRKYFSLISLSLALCVFIYVFYRSDRTVINQLLLLFVPEVDYHHWKVMINDVLPLKDTLIFSLPEALWVFCITITSRFFRIDFLWYRIEAAVIPLVLAFSMEFFQLIHLSNGRFDLADLLFAFVFWWVAYRFTDTGGEQRSLRLRSDLNSLSCIFSYGIVYFAHVIN